MRGLRTSANTLRGGRAGGWAGREAGGAGVGAERGAPAGRAAVAAVEGAGGKEQRSEWEGEGRRCLQPPAALGAANQKGLRWPPHTSTLHSVPLRPSARPTHLRSWSSVRLTRV